MRQPSQPPANNDLSRCRVLFIVAPNALYPLDIMPPWLRVVSHGNLLSYEVSALGGLKLGLHTN